MKKPFTIASAMLLLTMTSASLIAASSEQSARTSCQDAHDELLLYYLSQGDSIYQAAKKAVAYYDACVEHNP